MTTSAGPFLLTAVALAMAVPMTDGAGEHRGARSYIDPPAIPGGAPVASSDAVRTGNTLYIGGHLGRLGTRADIELHQRYIADIIASAQTALGSVDPTQYFVTYGENAWAGVRGYLDAVTAAAAEPVIAAYTGVLASADVKELTYTTTFMIMQSMRLDRGAGSQVHP